DLSGYVSARRNGQGRRADSGKGVEDLEPGEIEGGIGRVEQLSVVADGGEPEAIAGRRLEGGIQQREAIASGLTMGDERGQHLLELGLREARRHVGMIRYDRYRHRGRS